MHKLIVSGAQYLHIVTLYQHLRSADVRVPHVAAGVHVRPQFVRRRAGDRPNDLESPIRSKKAGALRAGFPIGALLISKIVLRPTTNLHLLFYFFLHLDDTVCRGTKHPDDASSTFPGRTCRQRVSQRSGRDCGRYVRETCQCNGLHSRNMADIFPKELSAPMMVYTASPFVG